MAAIGNREAAIYLSGSGTREITVFCFVWAAMCSALAGVLLAGYANRAYQAHAAILRTRRPAISLTMGPGRVVSGCRGLPRHRL